MVMRKVKLSGKTVAAAAIVIGVIAATGCDMTPKKIEKTVKEAGTADEQVDKVMQDFK
jgi:hypothetical protein